MQQKPIGVDVAMDVLEQHVLHVVRDHHGVPTRRVPLLAPDVRKAQIETGARPNGAVPENAVATKHERIGAVDDDVREVGRRGDVDARFTRPQHAEIEILEMRVVEIDGASRVVLDSDGPVGGEGDASNGERFAAAHLQRNTWRGGSASRPQPCGHGVDGQRTGIGGANGDLLRISFAEQAEIGDGTLVQHAVALAQVEEDSGRRRTKHDRGHVESVATNVHAVLDDAERTGDEVSPAREIELMAERRISALAGGEGGTDGERSSVAPSPLAPNSLTSQRLEGAMLVHAVAPTPDFL